ncbi:hypothetical protein SAMN05216404_10237 [Nitrosospira multiformis]|uniref:Uncharacterized protein n=1 Tax=Nitrosospira multiformis TaxID=1231 RepID=A0A1H8CRY4_9PROT|nr:hypothetical protein SAMN05216404_10237 [Nitrosospira multiformis]
MITIETGRLAPEPNDKLSIELKRFAFEHYGNCTKCGYQFKELEVSHWGFDSIGHPMYVCEDCAPYLAEPVWRECFMAHSYIL